MKLKNLFRDLVNSKSRLPASSPVQSTEGTYVMDYNGIICF